MVREIMIAHLGSGSGPRVADQLCHEHGAARTSSSHASANGLGSPEGSSDPFCPTAGAADSLLGLLGPASDVPRPEVFDQLGVVLRPFTLPKEAGARRPERDQRRFGEDFVGGGTDRAQPSTQRKVRPSETSSTREP